MCALIQTTKQKIYIFITNKFQGCDDKQKLIYK